MLATPRLQQPSRIAALAVVVRTIVATVVAGRVAAGAVALADDPALELVHDASYEKVIVVTGLHSGWIGPPSFEVS